VTESSTPSDTDLLQHPSVDADGIARRPLAQRFTQATYVPASLFKIASYWSWNGTRIYRRRFGIGTNEFAVMGSLSNFPGITWAGLCENLRMNKATASTSVAKLLEREFVASELDGRARRLYLTAEGVRVFEQMRPIAAEREQKLLDGLTADEIASLKAILDKMVDRSSVLQRYDGELLNGRSGLDGDGSDDAG